MFFNKKETVKNKSVRVIKISFYDGTAWASVTRYLNDSVTVEQAQALVEKVMTQYMEYNMITIGGKDDYLDNTQICLKDIMQVIVDTFIKVKEN